MVEGAKKPKVLIVDDTPENIQVLMGTLKDQYAIVAAINGEKALKMAACRSAAGSHSSGHHDAGNGRIRGVPATEGGYSNAGHPGHLSFRPR